MRDYRLPLASSVYEIVQNGQTDDDRKGCTDSVTPAHPSIGEVPAHALAEALTPHPHHLAEVPPEYRGLTHDYDDGPYHQTRERSPGGSEAHLIPARESQNLFRSKQVTGR